jgi:CheY-like chemotaxis protein
LLRLSRAIISGHSGRIRLTAGNFLKYQGTRKLHVFVPVSGKGGFSFTLKRAFDSERRCSVAARLLVVDDEEKVRIYLARLLARRGYEVETAADGALALEKVAKEDFDAVLLDVLMPGMSGMEVLPRIKKLKPMVEVIMLTGNASVKIGVESMKLGAFNYLLKPINLEKLTECLTEALEHGRFV